MIDPLFTATGEDLGSATGQETLPQPQSEQQLPVSFRTPPPSPAPSEAAQLREEEPPVPRQLPTSLADTRHSERSMGGEVLRGGLHPPTAWQGASPPLAYGMSLSREQAGALMAATGAGITGGWVEQAAPQGFVAHAPVGFPLDLADLQTPPPQVSPHSKKKPDDLIRRCWV